MAKDDKNTDKEQDDFFGDDEDFGLPELDYEALDDDDSDDVQEEPKAEEAPAEEPKVEEKEEESVSAEDDSVFESESMDDMDMDMDDMDDLEGLDDLDDEDIPDQVTDEELEASLAGDSEEDDLKDEPDPVESKSEDKDASGEEMDDFYEEESFDDFDVSGDDGEEIPDSVFDSDVLDEDEFAQFEKELMETEEGEMADMSSFDDDTTPAAAESKGKFAKVVIFGIIIFAALGAIFWFMSPLGSGGEEEKQPVAEKAQTQKPVAEKPVEKQPEETASTGTSTTGTSGGENATATKPAETQPKTPAQRPAANTAKPKPQQVASNPGTVNSLTARTGNAFIIIASFVDGDMAMDYANKLAGQGKSPSIIPPFGNAITHRVAISGYPSIAAAQNALGGFQGEFGQDIWILKY